MFRWGHCPIPVIDQGPLNAADSSVCVVREITFSDGGSGSHQADTELKGKLSPSIYLLVFESPAEPGEVGMYTMRAEGTFLGGCSPGFKIPWL